MIVLDFVLNVQTVIYMEEFVKLSVRLATTAPLIFLVIRANFKLKITNYLIDLLDERIRKKDRD